MDPALFWPAILLIVLMALLGAPIFAVLGAAGAVLFMAAGIDSSATIVEFYRIASTPILTAIPLFTFAGYLLAESGAPQRLVALTRALFGWIPGGVAIVALVTCAVFTAFTGASGVTIIALGGLLLPMLSSQGYSEKFSLGLLTTSGSLGLLFPPSLPLILYGMVASNSGMSGGSASAVSIDKLFIAGIVPGVLLVAALSAYGVARGLAPGVKTEPFSFRATLDAVRAAGWELPLPVIILAGIYGGWITATEAAAITVVYVFVVEVLIRRDLRLGSDVPRIMRESMLLVGAVILILGCALGLTNYLIDAEVPMNLFEFIRNHIDSRAMFLVLLNLFLIVVGMMMDIFSAIIVVVPLIIPIATAYDIDPIHLGIIFLTNLEIGYLTPPVGLNLFISSIRFGKPIGEVLGALVPYLLILFASLIVITYVPELSTYLVELLGIK